MNTLCILDHRIFLVQNIEVKWSAYNLFNDSRRSDHIYFHFAINRLKLPLTTNTTGNVDELKLAR